MKRTLTSIAAGIVAALAFSSPALAAPVASFTADSAPAVGQPTTFTADNGTDCNVNRCDWSWFFVYGGAYKTGGQLGTGGQVRWVPTAFSASKPYVLVVLKVTAPGGTNGYTVAAHAYVVQP